MRPQAAPSPRPPAGPAFDGTLARLCCAFMPVTVIKRRWRGMGLLGSYGVHLYGLLLAAVGLLLVDSAFNPRYSFFNEVRRVFVRADDDQRLVMLAVFLLLILLVESGWIVLAWVLMPWGAAPEPWRRSMNRGLARLYQLTPFFALSLVVLVLGFHLIDEATARFRYDHALRMSVRETGGLSYQTARLLAALLVAGYMLSQLAVALWATAVHRDRPTWPAHCPWPAVCEGCGYPLVGMRRGQACPECGGPVDGSLDSPRNKPDRHGVLRKMYLAVRRPYAFGKSMPLYRPTAGHRKALWIGAALLFLTAPIGRLIQDFCFFLYDGYWHLTLETMLQDYDWYVLQFTITAAATVVAGVGFGLFSATLLGTFARLFQQRNALHLAARGFAYQSATLSVFVLGGYLLAGIGYVLEEHYYYGSAGVTPVWVDLYGFVILGYIVLMLAAWVGLQGRLLRGARHGNG